MNYLSLINGQLGFVFEKDLFLSKIEKKFCPLRLKEKLFVNKDAMKPHFGNFQGKVGNCPKGWEKLWEFLDFSWELLRFGSSNTDFLAGYA